MLSDDPLWYKDAIIYELHIKAFFDANNDGIGDFAGLAQKLDYLADLGITAVWLLPFYPSPLRDDGYDIADYRDVNPAYGSLRDFTRFVRAAHERGIRVITELVMNHTSDQHPWFQRARAAKAGSVWRDFYVWSENDQRYRDARIIFLDTEKSNWAWDSHAQQYYWHRFFSHQPDLNFANPRVLKEIKGVLKFWLDRGVDGLRLDAIPYLWEREGTNCENLPESHATIREVRTWLDANYPNRMLLAEANQWPEDVRPYFGDGDECHMAFHFPLMPRIYMAIAQEDRHPVTDILRQTPDIPDNCQWSVFLRNHDELTLEMVTDRERDYLWSFYAADRRARLNLGIRRRLAPLLDNDRRKIELLNSLLMSLPGTPVVYYGDEIGMGDNTFLGDRDGVRTPMQWSPDRNAGFSRADPAQLYLPTIMDPLYGYEAVNVEAQSRISTSLLNWTKRLITVRKAHRAFGRGTITLLFPANRRALAYLRRFEGEDILCIANLSRAPQPVELSLAEFKGRVPVELLGRSSFPPIGDLPYFITLPGYGFYWFVLAEAAQAPAWHETPAAPLPELHTLVAPRGWQSIVAGDPLKMLAERILPEFAAHQRWFAAKGRAVDNVRMGDHAELTLGENSWLLASFVFSHDGGRAERYFVPLAFAWEGAGEDPLLTRLSATLARVRRGPRVGVLYDAAADPGFGRAMVEAMIERREIATHGGARLHFEAAPDLATRTLSADIPIGPLGVEQTNSSIRLGDEAILKIYRHPEAGVHPEIEMNRYLSTDAGYANTPPFLGSLEERDPSGAQTSLAVLQGFIANQGDGWSLTLNHLQRYFEELELLSSDAVIDAAEHHAVYLTQICQLGVRTAELHRALARATDDPHFCPEPITAEDMANWANAIGAQVAHGFAALEAAVKAGLPDGVQDRAKLLLARRRGILGQIDKLLPARIDAAKTRYHGDLHLGQVIVVKNDFHIIDFEGEPARPLAERRIKHCPLRDVAGVLRSFNYAGFSALIARASERPERLTTLLPHAQDWEQRSCDAFLGGYRDTIADAVSFPRRAATVDRLLRAFAIEKAFYELSYEAAHRPDWVQVPINGACRLFNIAI